MHDESEQANEQKECVAGIFTVRQQVTGRKQAVLEHREQAGHFPLLLQFFLHLICRADSYSLTGRMSREIKEKKIIDKLNCRHLAKEMEEPHE